MALLDKLFNADGTVDMSSREAKLQELIAEGNEYMRQHKDENYAVLMLKEAEIEEQCKKLHGYFYKEPDVQLLLTEAAQKYQREEGTRYSVDKQGNRLLNYHGD